MPGPPGEGRDSGSGGDEALDEVVVAVDETGDAVAVAEVVADGEEA